MILAFFCTAEISFLCTDYIGYLFHNVRMIFCCLLVFCHLAHGLPLRHSFEFNCHAKMDRYTLQGVGFYGTNFLRIDSVSVSSITAGW